jgi:hypothetical protein
MSRSLNNLQLKTLFVKFVMILIILFYILNTFILYRELPQNIILHINVKCI